MSDNESDDEMRMKMEKDSNNESEKSQNTCNQKSISFEEKKEVSNIPQLQIDLLLNVKSENVDKDDSSLTHSQKDLSNFSLIKENNIQPNTFGDISLIETQKNKNIFTEKLQASNIERNNNIAQSKRDFEINNSSNQNKNFKFQNKINYKNNNENFQKHNKQNCNYSNEGKSNNPECIYAIQKAFTSLDEQSSIHALNLIQSNSSQTIFELMNDLQTENIIQKTKKLYNVHKPFLSYIDILESINHSYLNETDSLLIKYFKTFSQDNSSLLDLPSEYYFTNPNEQRRPLMKNEDGVYNYIPIMCKIQHEDDAERLSCYFAHSANEIKYHTLIYKTKLCKRNNCDKQRCFHAHSFNDLRIIYDYTNKEICQLIQLFSSEKNSKIDNYIMYLPWYKEHIKSFDLNNFKTLKCKIPNCNKDTHLCYYYHSITEKRRPQFLFRYCNRLCRYIKEDNCYFGDFCNYCHSKYEYYYHPKNFQRITQCTRKKNKYNECIYIDTCYGIHNNENILSFKGNNKENEKKIKEKIKTCNEILQKFPCKNCHKIPKDYIYSVLICKCVLCLKCFKLCIKENQCIICKETFEKGKAFKIEMGEKYKLIHKNIISNININEENKVNNNNKNDNLQI